MKVRSRFTWLVAVALLAAACDESEPSYVLDAAKLKADRDRYFKARDKFIVEQACGMQSKAFEEFALFISGDAVRFEEIAPIKGREKKVGQSPIVNGLFKIPETVTVARIERTYKVVDEGGVKSIHLADPKASPGTVCIYPLKKR